MQKLTINKILATIAVCSIGFISYTAYAGQDSVQHEITQRVMQAKQKLKETKAATGTKKQDLMGEHIKMMQVYANDAHYFRAEVLKGYTVNREVIVVDKTAGKFKPDMCRREIKS